MKVFLCKFIQVFDCRHFLITRTEKNCSGWLLFCYAIYSITMTFTMTGDKEMSLCSNSKLYIRYIKLQRNFPVDIC
jgi:hypothetical protein